MGRLTQHPGIHALERTVATGDEKLSWLKKPFAFFREFTDEVVEQAQRDISSA